MHRDVRDVHAGQAGAAVGGHVGAAAGALTGLIGAIIGTGEERSLAMQPSRLSEFITLVRERFGVDPEIGRAAYEAHPLS